MTEGGNYRFIITGGPGSGKTSLINALAKSGYIIFPEIARQLMESGVEAPVNQNNPEGGSKFYKAVLKKRIIQHEEGNGSGICFYDRALPDSLGFMKYLGLKPPESLYNAISSHPYNRNVFILPPWKEIYHQDKIRRESFVTASEIYECIKLAYIEAGYNLIGLPLLHANKRSEFILEKLRNLDLLSNKPVSEGS